MQLAPVFKPKIWGRRHLSPLFEGREAAGGGVEPRGAGEQPPGELIGEIWLTDEQARFVNGPAAGMTLGEASEKYGPELHGQTWPGRSFPLLAKYIFTSDWLSVQVHPDDEYAALKEPGNRGKCEMWYMLQTASDSAFLLGLKRGVTLEQLHQAFKTGTSRSLLEEFTPTAEEAIFVPPGMVHALGPGLVLFEVEENSDLTYRLDDFGRLGLDGRPRPLHLEKGLEVIRRELAPQRQLPRVEMSEDYGTRRLVLASRFFALEELRLPAPAAFSGSAERLELLSFLEGEGQIASQTDEGTFHRGETWLVPPGAGHYRLMPARATRLLKFYVPEIERDFRRPLAERGIPAKLADAIIFE